MVSAVVLNRESSANDNVDVTCSCSCSNVSVSSHEPRSSPQHSFRMKALANICQFRECSHESSSIQAEVGREMNEVRKSMCKDLQNANEVLNPDYYRWCHSCGRQVRKWFCLSESHPSYENYMKLLNKMLYKTHSDKSILLCLACNKTLRKGTIPEFCLQKGWHFLLEKPNELVCLSRHEMLLISLRLPCIPLWRIRGGHGQYASRGIPVCYANLVSDVAKFLPRDPTKVFTVLLANGRTVLVSVEKIRNALNWLISNNKLYKNVKISSANLERIGDLEKEKSMVSDMKFVNPTAKDAENAQREQEELGSHSTADGESVYHFTGRAEVGTEQISNDEQMKDLIKFILLPYKFRKLDTLPFYDATNNLESYFPHLFPHGFGGPSFFGIQHLSKWLEHVLLHYNSRFSKDVNFIFFIHAVWRRRRLSHLSLNAPIRDRTSRAVLEVKDMLSEDDNLPQIQSRIEYLIRSGALNACFETLRGTPAFWSRLGKTAWAYLSIFGPCQLFISLSPADLIDPFVFMQINEDLNFEEASNLNPAQRAEMLANNPVAASTIFQRRLDALLKNFLFGHSRPFGEIRAYLGRVEQQCRLSPHVHLLLWLSNRLGDTYCCRGKQNEAVAEFIELFSTAIIPPDYSDEDSPRTSSKHLRQVFPYPSVPSLRTKHNIVSHTFSRPMKGSDVQNAICQPFDENILNGSTESNRKLRKVVLATQLHRCRTYCRKDDKTCRFLFPFPIQERASVAKRSSDKNDSRQIALCPRNDSYLNSTHPLLTGMFRCNTDVTVITGNSIRESLYVCSYAVKSDKNPVLDPKSLNYLRNIYEDDMSERLLLSKISRASEGVRTVGAQEAIDNLLNRTLVLKSAKVENIFANLLLRRRGALPIEDWNARFKKDSSEHTFQCDLLKVVDGDSNVFRSRKVGIHTPENDEKSLDDVEAQEWKLPDILEKYIRRPSALENLTSSQFHIQYYVRKMRLKPSGELPENRSVDMVLLDKEGDYDSVNRNRRQKRGVVDYAYTRKTKKWEPSITHVLNVPIPSNAPISSPEVCAAALLLHFPFRSLNGLLNGVTVTERVSELLQAGDETVHDLKRYIQTIESLSEAHNFPKMHEAANSSMVPPEDYEVSENQERTLGMDSSEDEGDEISGLPELLKSAGNGNPFQISKEWNGSFVTNSQSGRGTSLNVSVYRSYVKLCKAVGVKAANNTFKQNSENEGSHTTTEGIVRDSDFGYDSRESSDLERLWAVKSSILEQAKTEEQQVWIKSVISYLQVYYKVGVKNVPEYLEEECAANHPIFTNAPGGTGKSWLLSKLCRFINDCIPSYSTPCYSRSTSDIVSEGIDLEIAQSELPFGRFGKVAVMAPSGVAAANCEGHTIHSALRTRSITLRSLSDDPSASLLEKLQADFRQVLCIILDEYSMISLTILGYLDRLLRKLRPSYAEVPFGGIPVIVSGDAYQLPPVRSPGILSMRENIVEALRPVHDHFNEKVFSLSLSESVRQGDDKTFFEILSRLRLASCTQDDANLLNTRVFTDLSMVASDGNESSWRYAPVLTSKNKKASLINQSTISRNGALKGTFFLHNVPILRQRGTLESRIKRTEKLLLRSSPKREQEGYNPPNRMVFYPGIPIMLRTNICPELGLCNGAIGKVLGVLFGNISIPSHENIQEAAQRIARTSMQEAVPSLLVYFPDNYTGIVSAVSQDATTLQDSKTVVIDPVRMETCFGLPVSVAHSFTIHKSQSLTLSSVIVDPEDVFTSGALYVAFSRVRRLENLALTSSVSTKMLNKFSKKVRKITERLRTIESAASSFEPYLTLVSQK